MIERNDILLSCTVVGNSMKVIAIEEATQLEVSLIVPKNTQKDDLKRLVLQKLNYVKNKNNLL